HPHLVAGDGRLVAQEIEGLLRRRDGFLELVETDRHERDTGIGVPGVGARPPLLRVGRRALVERERRASLAALHGGASIEEGESVAPGRRSRVLRSGRRGGRRGGRPGPPPTMAELRRRRRHRRQCQRAEQGERQTSLERGHHPIMARSRAVLQRPHAMMPVVPRRSRTKFWVLLVVVVVVALLASVSYLIWRQSVPGVRVTAS